MSDIIGSIWVSVILTRRCEPTEMLTHSQREGVYLGCGIFGARLNAQFLKAVEGHCASKAPSFESHADGQSD